MAKPANTTPPPARFERIGLRKRPANDAYHFLLTTSWRYFFGVMTVIYVAVNALFALAYLLEPGCLENARRGNFADAFFFSVQTMATIGYGKMLPATTYANLLVTFESILGIFGVALVTGLTFAKFARPTARVLFSNVATISVRDGVRSLMVRMANERASYIVDVNLFMVLSISDLTSEGEVVRRFHPLDLVRSRAATFALTWTTVHPIIATSPLFGLDAAELQRRNADIILIITGIDETFAQTVHARVSYSASQIRFDQRFADVIREIGPNHRVVDYSHFHDTIPIEG